MTSVFEQITAISTAVIALALIILAIVIIPLAGHFRRAYRKIDHLLDHVYTDITPIVKNAHDIGDNVNFVTTAIRADIEKVSATLDAANERVQDALAQAERRIGEFNALLAVAQDEAESLFVSAASTVRGVQRGTEAFRQRRGMDLASEELDAAEPAADQTNQEAGHGNDSNTESTETTGSAAPRIRPRPGTRRRA